MPLDTDIKKLLGIIESNKIRNLDSVSPDEYRSLFRQSALIFSGPKEDVEKVWDDHFNYDGSDIPMRIYKPAGAKDGAIVYYHGGGFVTGDIESYDSLCRKIANTSRSTVISVGYRLAPENKFPTWSNDSFEAFKWVRANSDKLKIDGSKIVVSGDSAGGKLAFVVALMLLDNNLMPPRTIVSLYPTIGTDLFSESSREYSEGMYLDRALISYFVRMIKLSASDIASPYNSIILHPKLSGLPESVVVTAEYDPLRDQGETFLSKLRDFGVRATGIRALGMIHGFASFSGVVPAADRLLRMIYANIG
jgi:acetyl esterase